HRCRPPRAGRVHRPARHRLLPRHDHRTDRTGVALVGGAADHDRRPLPDRRGSRVPRRAAPEEGLAARAAAGDRGGPAHAGGVEGMSTTPNRTPEEIRAEIEVERQGLARSVGELRAEANEAVGQAKRIGAVTVAVVGTYGLMRALLRLRG